MIPLANRAAFEIVAESVNETIAAAENNPIILYFGFPGRILGRHFSHFGRLNFSQTLAGMEPVIYPERSPPAEKVPTALGQGHCGFGSSTCGNLFTARK